MSTATKPPTKTTPVAAPVAANSVMSALRVFVWEFFGLVQFLLFVGALFVYAPIVSSVTDRITPLQWLVGNLRSGDVDWVDWVDRVIPFFIVSITTEVIVSRRREANKLRLNLPGNGANAHSLYPSYRVNDTLNSMSLGLIQQMVHSLYWAKPLLYAPYMYVWEHHAIVRLPVDSVWTWLLCFLAVEMGYYWYHRMGHEMNVFWSAHIAHHSSQEYNLSTALRQGSWQYFFAFIYYCPGAFFIPPPVFNALASFNRIYQFWIHTEYIDRLPDWYEYVFTTPSHHRVHHAANPQYCDKNYGGTLIIFDRMFGTFELEVEPPVYGLTRNLNSWNPLWANVHHWQQMYGMSKKLNGLSKFRVLWNGPGWNPTNGTAYQLPVKTPGEKRHNSSVYTAASHAYCIVNYVATILILKVLAIYGKAMTSFETAWCVLFILATATVIGARMDHRKWYDTADRARIIVLTAAAEWIAYDRLTAVATAAADATPLNTRHVMGGIAAAGAVLLVLSLWLTAKESHLHKRATPEGAPKTKAVVNPKTE